MGKKKSAPVYQPPAPPSLPTAQDLYGQAQQFGQSQMPMAYGAREGALGDLARGNDYYNQFQPTSFEQALGNQYFQNVWPDTQATIQHGLSMSGIESSPVLGAMLGKARGDLGFDIGSYLANQGNQRATNSLEARLGIDPMHSLLQPFANTAATQGNAQAGVNYDYQQQLAQAQYQQAMNKYQQQQGMASMFGKVGGAGLGAILAPMTGGLSLGAGAALGAGFGDMFAPAWGGGQSGDMGSYLQMANMLQPGGFDWMNQGQGRNVNPSTYSSQYGSIRK